MMIYAFKALSTANINRDYGGDYLPRRKIETVNRLEDEIYPDGFLFAIRNYNLSILINISL
jgi:hypothetical protein